MVIAQSNGSQTASKQSQIEVVTTALFRTCLEFITCFLYLMVVLLHYFAVWFHSVDYLFSVYFLCCRCIEWPVHVGWTYVAVDYVTYVSQLKTLFYHQCLLYPFTQFHLPIRSTTHLQTMAVAVTSSLLTRFVWICHRIYFLGHPLSAC